MWMWGGLPAAAPLVSLSSCKLWKLQSESHDVDPTEISWEVEGVIYPKRDLQRRFRKSPLAPPMRSPLDQHRVTQIEFFIVCMERLVST
jgi:hypothetical protein